MKWLRSKESRRAILLRSAQHSPWEIDMRPVIERLVQEIQMKVSVSLMAAKFHNTLVAVIVEACRRLRETDGLNLVCLSGGTFQNAYLLERLVPALRESWV